MIPESTILSSRYIISKHIATGGMAEIYEATDTYYHLPVGIKIIKESACNDNNLALFRNEINIASIFNNEHIYHIYNVGEYHGRPFMVYELLNGFIMKEILDERGSFSLEETKGYFIQILDAIKDIHNKNISHNDLKPDNLIYLHDGTIKLVDFGIASHFNTKYKKFITSASYVAPEAIKNKCFTAQSDIYSLGIIFFEFLTGKTPYMKSNTKDELNAHLKEKIPSIKNLAFTTDYKKIDKFIKRCTNKSLRRRYKTVNEVEKGLLDL